MFNKEVQKFSRKHGLTERHQEVLQCLVDGHDRDGLLERLNIKMPTLNHHLERIFFRTGTNSKVGVLQLFIDFLHKVR